MKEEQKSGFPLFINTICYLLIIYSLWTIALKCSQLGILYKQYAGLPAMSAKNGQLLLDKNLLYQFLLAGLHVLLMLITLLSGWAGLKRKRIAYMGIIWSLYLNILVFAVSLGLEFLGIFQTAFRRYSTEATLFFSFITLFDVLAKVGIIALMIWIIRQLYTESVKKAFFIR
ncbi:hypothetical protein FW774_17470 [Pedobacter sp. BS3]|uniref:hypothetical protein n=1 Tax=Pedobacter sp. BS3 TaxID=2567937 RepID=UPI0011EE8FE5|nr:hypothetical protein [Pedobacter sp. BS3]TZF81844.1 hypothetical protein FW774_17470 [Pedobacter sp. BS3]